MRPVSVFGARTNRLTIERTLWVQREKWDEAG